MSWLRLSIRPICIQGAWTVRIAEKRSSKLYYLLSRFAFECFRPSTYSHIGRILVDLMPFCVCLPTIWFPFIHFHRIFFFAKIWEFYCIFYVILFSLSRSNPFGRYGICHWCQYGERCTHIRCCHKIYAAKYCGRANTNRKINDYAAKKDARCGGGR